jgi:hypothetical protein
MLDTDPPYYCDGRYTKTNSSSPKKHKNDDVTFVELSLVLHTLGLDLELLELLPGRPAPHRPLYQHHASPVSLVAPSEIHRRMKQWPVGIR